VFVLEALAAPRLFVPTEEVFTFAEAEAIPQHFARSALMDAISAEISFVFIRPIAFVAAFNRFLRVCLLFDTATAAAAFSFAAAAMGRGSKIFDGRCPLI